MIVGLIIALNVISALFGTSSTTGAQPSDRSGSGSRSVPIPMHHFAEIGGGWWVRVNSVRPNGSFLFSGKPPALDRDYLMKVTLSYRGGGQGDASQIVYFALQAEGAHDLAYTASHDSCVGPPAFGVWLRLFSGVSETGPICFKVAAKDVASLMLHSTGQDTPYNIDSLADIKSVWFSLRSKR